MSVERPRLLLVEDDPDLRELLVRGLHEHGFAVDGVEDAASALRRTGLAYDAMVLDVGLPDADGRDLCQALRAAGVVAPVLFLTAHDRLPDRLATFAAGGDDHVGKPFHLAEVVARLQSLIRRAAPPGPVAPPLLDPVVHGLSTAHGSEALTPTEFRLMAGLLAAPGRVLRRPELVRAGWPGGSRVADNTLDQYVARLRRKLLAVQAPGLLETVHGVGYCWRPGPEGPGPAVPGR